MLPLIHTAADTRWSSPLTSLIRFVEFLREVFNVIAVAVFPAFWVDSEGQCATRCAFHFPSVPTTF